MLGPAVLMGVSNDAPSTAHLPTAYREALLALELADRSARVVQFSEISTRRMMVHLAAESLGRVRPLWTDPLLRADAAMRGELGRTLQAYADADMNVLKAAKKLGVHPNTVYFRMQRILDVTELDPRSYHDLTELLIVLDCEGATR